MKKLLLIQPGAYGDIFICAPIAKYYYDREYEIEWPITREFLSLLKSFPYVKPVLLDDEVLHTDWLKSDVMKILRTCDLASYDLVLNLADRGPHLTAQLPTENFEQVKYRLSDVPYKFKYKLDWKRDEKKEKELYEKVVDNVDYVVAHFQSSLGDRGILPVEEKRKVVEIKPIYGYSIFDWLMVIVKAQAVYCVESAVHQLIDGIFLDEVPKYLLRRPGQPMWTISEYWDKRYL